MRGVEEDNKGEARDLARRRRADIPGGWKRMIARQARSNSGRICRISTSVENRIMCNRTALAPIMPRQVESGQEHVTVIALKEATIMEGIAALFSP